MPDPDPAARPDQLPLVARGLQRRYGPFRALAGVDLHVRRGEFLTVFGPNGAGKTTLLRIVASLIRPTGGTLAVFGVDPRRAPDQVKRRIGLIAHNGYLYGGLSALDNLRFYARLYDVPSAADRADRLLAEVGLADRAGDLVRTYSRGMQQRLSIARALIHDPDLVLLDEPYTGLDQHASRMLRGILEQVSGRGRSVIMVTHHIEEGLGLSSRVAVMTRGRIAWQAEAAGLTRGEMERTYHEVVGAAA
ncbi:MAG TPA: heme ABC exporter ATP-binding protein CcmA [Candidatus Polarisedimenticolia bacterium]|nr:heme ABC exporter ATP-binding protein CcmA [Candidatus Polarisedimenticolia bacterium]